MIGCMFDADARRISFSYNGADLGAAFENVPVVAGGYAPAVTVAPGCAFAFNLGAMPMKHWPGPQYTMLEQLPVSVSVCAFADATCVRLFYPPLSFISLDLCCSLKARVSPEKLRISNAYKKKVSRKIIIY